MKLAKVEHVRCGEPVGWKNGSGTTYVWIPTSMEQPQFEQLCEQARDWYLHDEQELKKLAPVSPPGYGASIEHYPDTMTVAEVKADYEVKAAKYKSYQAMCTEMRKPFSHYVCKASMGVIKLFWEEKPEISHELSWGHQHGVTVDYGATKIGDYPPTEDEMDVEDL